MVAVHTKERVIVLLSWCTCQPIFTCGRKCSSRDPRRTNETQQIGISSPRWLFTSQLKITTELTVGDCFRLLVPDASGSILTTKPVAFSLSGVISEIFTPARQGNLVQSMNSAGVAQASERI